MKGLLSRYKSLTRSELDYLQFLDDSNIYGKGKHLKHDADARKEIITLLNEMEAKHDFEAALRLLRNGEVMTPEKMNVSCELEYQMFFRPGKFKHALYIGCGGYPLITTYVLERDLDIRFACMDIVPYATAICDMVVEELGFAERVHAFTGNVLEFTESDVGEYDAYFLSSAVRPKNTIIQKLLEIKTETAKIYAREDASHPDFYEPVEVKHPDLLSARGADLKWKEFIGKRKESRSSFSDDRSIAV